MKKTALFLVSLLMMLGGAAGQNGSSTGHFDWVRGYAPGENVSIIGSVTDSLGNLYILGSFNFESRWENGELIMPITPHNGAQNGVNTLIAKISPEGEMVWKKVIHGNYFQSLPHDIKAVGDTAFACLVTMPLATRDFYLYYLDTLVEATSFQNQPWPDYPINAEGVEYKCLALITFDFDGNVLEQHFLQMSYLDRYGEDIYYVYPPNSGTNDYLSTEVPVYPSFAIDGDGYIYLSRLSDDQTQGGPMNGHYSVSDGTISAVKFWCDRRLVGVVPADSTLYSGSQVLKFTPHFDSLIYSRTVFQSQSTQCGSVVYIQTDQNGDLYVIGRLSGNDSSYMVLDSVRSIFINILRANRYKGYLVKFDSTLNVKYCISLEDSIIPSTKSYSMNWFNDIAFDYDSNLMFLCASTFRGTFSDTSSFYSILTYQGIPLNRLKNVEFFMSFWMDDSAKLHSYGYVPSIYSSQQPNSTGMYNVIKCQKNRVFVQTRAVGGLRFPNGNIVWTRWNDYGLGLVVFDYQGHVIGGYSYSAISPDNEPGPIMIKDSLLYLVNRLSSDATFGDIHVPSRGDYFACIAKYVDTAFMTPYVRRVTEDTTIRVEVVQEEWTRVLYPNPTSGRVTVVMNGRPLRELYVAGMDGIAEPLPFSAIGDGRYAADLTDRPDGAYVLVMVSDDEHAYRSTVILQR